MSTASGNRSMKVRISLTVDVDPEAWDLAYGTGSSAREIRDDVKTYVQDRVLSSAAFEEDDAILNVTLN